MADRPLLEPLPADLPEDWTSGQIVAPSGADVGLSEQHGYNYLMEQVNRAQRAANAINESFDTISGKRTCRVTIGTSTAGWTQADCDYLCDGTDDQEELNAAIQAVFDRGGGEIAVLGGEYNLSAAVTVSSPGLPLAITGEPGTAVFNLSGDIELSSSVSHIPNSKIPLCRLFGIVFQTAGAAESAQVTQRLSHVVIECCTFLNVSFGNNYGSDKPIAFIFKGNRVEISKQYRIQYGSISTVTADNSLCTLFSGNTFSIEADYIQESALAFILLYMLNDQPAIFTNNTVSAFGAQPFVLEFTGNILATNNVLFGIGIHATHDGTVAENTVVNGNIDVFNTSVCGNKTINGSIYASGSTLVSDNYISATEDKPAIVAYKNGPGVDVDAVPSIVGNYIVSGSIGIYLEKPKWDSNNRPYASDALVSNNRIWGCETPIQIDDNWSRCMVTGNMFPAGSAIVDHGTDNIIRLNSDDPGGGSGGGGTAGVSSFNGRTGVVLPQSGDYTAAMVGAVASGAVQTVKVLTQTEYDALGTKDASTLYLIKE